MNEEDLASDRERIAREDALRKRKPNGPESTGFCLNCNARLAGGRRWCDPECREDWELRDKFGV